MPSMFNDGISLANKYKWRRRISHAYQLISKFWFSVFIYRTDILVRSTTIEIRNRFGVVFMLLLAGCLAAYHLAVCAYLPRSCLLNRGSGRRNRSKGIAMFLPICGGNNRSANPWFSYRHHPYSTGVAWKGGLVVFAGVADRAAPHS